MARVWMFFVLMITPVAAHAFGGHGGGKGAFSVLLMAGVAVLGYWVLKQNKGEKGGLMWAGRMIGWVLAVVGLLGFLCGVGTMHKCGSKGKTCLTKAGKAHDCPHKAIKKDLHK